MTKKLALGMSYCTAVLVGFFAFASPRQATGSEIKEGTTTYDAINHVFTCDCRLNPDRSCGCIFS